MDRREFVSKVGLKQALNYALEKNIMVSSIFSTKNSKQVSFDKMQPASKDPS
jgi:hypothetical protein